MVSLARLPCVIRQSLTRSKRASGCVAVRSAINTTTLWHVFISIEVLHESTCQKWGDPRSRMGNVEKPRSAVFSQSITQHVLILLILLSSSGFYYSRCSLISLYCCSASTIIYRKLIFIIFSVDNTCICSMLKYNIFISQKFDYQMRRASLICSLYIFISKTANG